MLRILPLLLLEPVVLFPRTDALCPVGLALQGSPVLGHRRDPRRQGLSDRHRQRHRTLPAIGELDARHGQVDQDDDRVKGIHTGVPEQGWELDEGRFERRCPIDPDEGPSPRPRRHLCRIPATGDL